MSYGLCHVPNGGNYPERGEGPNGGNYPERGQGPNGGSYPNAGFSLARNARTPSAKSGPV